MTEPDLKLILAVAEDLVVAIQRADDLRRLILARRRKPGRTGNSDGWYSTIGRLSSENTLLEIWLDHWAGNDRRAFWYGVCSKKLEAIQSIATRLTPELGRPLQRGDSDVSASGFMEQLQRSEYGVPITETYTGKYNFYGKYLFPNHGNLTPRAVSGVTSEVLALLRAIGGVSDPEEDQEFPEGRAEYSKHLRRERNAALVREAKNRALIENDRLACEVCGFDFADVYGDLGESFIEAHHIVPLSQTNELRRTRVEDLALVCSNCHRMLHRHRPWLGRKELKRILVFGDVTQD